MRKFTALLLLVIMLLALLTLVQSPATSAQQPRNRCFPETGYCVEGAILEYWETNGGLEVFGYPTTELRTETIEQQWTGPTQWFERDRLEDHGNDGGVLAGRLGALYLELQARPWFEFEQVESAPAGCLYFTQTNHSLCEPFLTYWRNNGAVPRFGYPITEPFNETITTDAGFTWEGTVQYFERRRMEHHTELPGRPVLLGLLGNEIRDLLAGPPLPTATPTLQPGEPTPTATPTGEPEPDVSGNRIAFAADRDGNFEIYVMNKDGTGQQNLTSSSARDTDPAWSPDGTRIAFASDRDGSSEIYVMNDDGSSVERLTNSDGNNFAPAWSPDGERIAFMSDRDGNQEIYVMDADDGSDLINLTSEASDDHSPTWSPNGWGIAYVSDRDGNDEIYVVRLDGTNKANLTSDPASDRDPAWGPNDERIAFSSGRGDNEDIYVMDIDGSDLIRLTNDAAKDTDPSWSPNGDQLVFRSNRDDNDEIYMMDDDGSDQENLTNQRNDDRVPAWAP
jgi:Tol biopolymer transport system component